MGICLGVVGCCCCGCFVKGVLGIVGGVVGLVVGVLWGCCEDVVVQAVWGAIKLLLGCWACCWVVVGMLWVCCWGCCCGVVRFSWEVVVGW